MASLFPGALDAHPTNHTDNESMGTIHATVHNDIADAINKIEAELGADPSGVNYTTVKARLAAPRILPFSKSGALSVAVGASRFYVPFTCTIVSIQAMVGTSPTGATLIVDVNKNGTTVFTTQANRPTVAAAGNVSGAAVPNVTALAAGDYISVDIDQVGSTVPGSDLIVNILYTL
jgi:hypothetical protein